MTKTSYKISELSEIYQGSILTRIKTNNSSGVISEAITMQELSYYCNQTDVLPIKNYVSVEQNKTQSCLYSEVGDVLVGLSSGKAMVVKKDRANKLIFSNFAIIRIIDFNLLDPYYLCWLINEDVRIRKQLESLYQSTFRVLVIPISTFKEITINLRNIDEQRQIGQIYDLNRRLTRIKRLKSDSVDKLINLYLKNIN